MLQENIPAASRFALYMRLLWNPGAVADSGI